MTCPGCAWRRRRLPELGLAWAVQAAEENRGERVFWGQERRRPQNSRFSRRELTPEPMRNQPGCHARRVTVAGAYVNRRSQ